eukprot:7883220-Alexandrium_andersonii.AAC.1
MTKTGQPDPPAIQIAAWHAEAGFQAYLLHTHLLQDPAAQKNGCDHLASVHQRRKCRKLLET